MSNKTSQHLTYLFHTASLSFPSQCVFVPQWPPSSQGSSSSCSAQSTKPTVSHGRRLRSADNPALQASRRGHSSAVWPDGTPCWWREYSREPSSELQPDAGTSSQTVVKPPQDQSSCSLMEAPISEAEPRWGREGEPSSTPQPSEPRWTHHAWQPPARASPSLLSRGSLSAHTLQLHYLKSHTICWYDSFRTVNLYIFVDKKGHLGRRSWSTGEQSPSAVYSVHAV